MQTPDPLPDYHESRQLAAFSLLLDEFRLDNVRAMYWRNRAPWGLAWRKLDDTFLLFPLKGAFRAVTKTLDTVVRPGAFLCLGNGVEHTLEIAEGEEELEQVALHCDWLNAWGLPLFSMASSQIGQLAAPQAIFEELRTLVCLTNRDQRMGDALGRSMILRLLAAEVAAGRLSFNVEGREGDAVVERVLYLIHQRYGDDLSVAVLAEEVGLSEVQLRKRFRKGTGRSPHEYLAEARLREAGRQLAHTQLSVSRVASGCGFNSVEYFCNCFRKAYGQSPRAYRAAQQDTL